MIHVSLTDADTAALRVTPSPLWETIGALLLLREREVGWPYEEWFRGARGCITRADRAALAPLLGVRVVLPDALFPAPGNGSTIDEELQRVIETAPEILTRAYARRRAPDELAAFSGSPSVAAEVFAGAIHRFWRRAVEPYWAAMRSIHEQERRRVGIQTISHGAAATLARLHPRIQWDRPVLTIEKRQEMQVSAAGRGVVFVPMVFSRAALLVSIDSAGAVGVAYPASGVAVVFGRRPPVEAESLGRLVGQRRAGVLRALQQPKTTRELAVELDLASSTVSHHIQVLRDAGLLDRHKVERGVLYSLNDRGVGFLELFPR